LERDSIHTSRHETLTLESALTRVKDMLGTVLKGLAALKKKLLGAMEAKTQGQLWLNEMQEIKRIVNGKIDLLFADLTKIYEKSVMKKLIELFETVEESREFVEQECLKLGPKLRPFFISDLEYDLKYYESCFEELEEKSTRKFKLGVQNDKIFKLVVNFEQNLQEIFQLETNSEPTLRKQHLILSKDGKH
jgi:hypothetical protein